jgi:hypothetical protein
MYENELSWHAGPPTIAIVRAFGRRTDQSGGAIAQFLANTMHARSCSRLLIDISASEFVENEASVMRGGSLIAVSIPSPSRVALLTGDHQRAAADVAASMFKHARHAVTVCLTEPEALAFLRQ